MWKKQTVAGMLLFAAAFAVAVEPDHRQHDAHVHGMGSVNVAVDGNSLMLELSIPAHDLVGFEHAPATEQEHQTVDNAVATLRDGLALFVPSAEAKCRQTRSDVKSALLEADHHDEDHDHESGHESHHGDEEETHAEFALFYQFECEHVKQLERLSFAIFQSFSGVRNLQVQFIGPSGQSGMKATPQQSVLSLQ